jgi:hypothetical protein
MPKDKSFAREVRLVGWFQTNIVVLGRIKLWEFRMSKSARPSGGNEVETFRDSEITAPGRASDGALESTDE